MAEVKVSVSSSEGELSEGTLAQSETKDDAAIKYKKQFLQVFKNAKLQPAEFAVSRQLDMPPILVIEIENIGAVHFPLYEEQAKNIIAKFKPCPFGKREKTIIDTTVRNSKQLDPHEFKILNSKWEKYLEENVLKLIASELSISTPFKASLYKLLLYEPGSFFKRHRDTEKEEGMFGTLVVQLPSRYAGGELVVQHENNTKTFNFSSVEHPEPDREFQMFFAAFYCDCQHEILPVTEGYRVCLVYNLVSTKDDSIPKIPKFAALEDRLENITKQWVQGHPDKIVFALSHKYTQSSLSFSNLKGEDRSVTSLLQRVSEKCPMKLFLAFFSKHVSGGAEGSEDSYSIIDPDYDYKLMNVKSFDGKTDLGEMTVQFINEVIPTSCFTGMDPDEEDYQEHSGNEGATVDKWYRGAAVVFWPEEHMLQVLEEANVSQKVMTDLYFQVYENYVACPGKNYALDQVLEWLPFVLSKNDEPALNAEYITKLLSSIISFGQLNHLESFLVNLDLTKLSDYTPVLEQCDLHGWKVLRESITQMMRKDGGILKLIDRLLLFIPEQDVTNAEKKEVLSECLKIIIAKQETTCTPSYYLYASYFSNRVPPQQNKQFFYKVFLAAKKLNFDMIDHAKNKTLLITQVLLNLLELPELSSHSVWINCAIQCVASLKSLISEPELPVNWVRNEKVDCNCQDCSKLQAFLKSNRAQETYKMSKQRRLHLHQKMNYMKDLKHETLRVGNPQTLVVTKTTETEDKKKTDKKQAAFLLPTLKQALNERNGSTVNYEMPTKIMKLEC